MKKLVITLIALAVIFMIGTSFMYIDLSKKLSEKNETTVETPSKKKEISTEEKKTVEKPTTEVPTAEEVTTEEPNTTEDNEKSVTSTENTSGDNLKDPSRRDEVKQCIMENTKGTSCIYTDYEPRILSEVYQELLSSGELPESCQGGMTTLDRINYSILQKVNGNGVCNKDEDISPVGCVTDEYESGCIENLTNFQINKAISEAFISGYYDESCSPVSLDKLTDDLEADNKWLVDILQGQKFDDEPCSGSVDG